MSTWTATRAKQCCCADTTLSPNLCAVASKGGCPLQGKVLLRSATSMSASQGRLGSHSYQLRKNRAIQGMVVSSHWWRAGRWRPAAGGLLLRLLAQTKRQRLPPQHPRQRRQRAGAWPLCRGWPCSTDGLRLPQPLHPTVGIWRYGSTTHGCEARLRAGLCPAPVSCAPRSKRQP